MSKRKRPNQEESKPSTLKKVNKLLKEGDYLEEFFYKSSLTKNTESIYGYKTFDISNKTNDHDKGFYETLINDPAKSNFGNFYRYLELGEFKNNKLNGIGARYLGDYLNKDTFLDVFLIGNFVDGLPHGNIFYYCNDGTEFDTFALTTWINGNYLSFKENYKEDFDVRDEIVSSIFWHPWNETLNKYNYENEKWWNKYKKNYFFDRPKEKDTYEDRIKKINELIGKGKDFDSDFIETKIFMGSSFQFQKFGLKKYKDPFLFGDFKGHDRGLYDTFVDEWSKAFLGNFVRDFEIGEFYKGQLNGYGCRYLIDNNSRQQILMFGNFINGLPDGKIYMFYFLGILLKRITLNKFNKGQHIDYVKLTEQQRKEIYNNSIFTRDIYAEVFTSKQKDKKIPEFWSKYKEEYNKIKTKNHRPYIGNANTKIIVDQVNRLTKNGKKLDEEFYESKISKGTRSIYGYKKFIIPKDFIGHDRGLYETLIGSGAQRLFGTYVRQVELGEFKNNQLNGFGVRYLSQEFGYDDNQREECCTAGIIGNFVNGLPNKKSFIYVEHPDRQRSEYALARWDNGKLISTNWGYKDKDINIEEEIQDSILWGGNPFRLIYESEKFWDNYKKAYL